MPGPLSVTVTRKRVAWLAGGGGAPLVGRHFDVDEDVGQDAGLLGRVERVVDGFLDAGE